MHWGQKIISGMILFMLFILSMSYYMFLQHTDTLVDDNYYEKGLVYDAELIKKTNALDSTALPLISHDSLAIHIVFKAPATFNIDLKRPADAALDQHFKSDLSVTNFNIPIHTLKKGLWSLELSWNANGKDYVIQNYLTQK